MRLEILRLTGSLLVKPRHSSKPVFAGKVFSIRQHSLVEPGGLRVTREVIHHRGSAVILPRQPDGRVLLVRQFRLAAAGSLWELPAGSLDPGESPLQTAKRELAEETGFRSSSWRKLVQFLPSPGFLTEKMTVFLAQNVRPGTATPEPDERIQVRAFEMKELMDRIRAGKIRDGKTLVGLLYLRWLES